MSLPILQTYKSPNFNNRKGNKIKQLVLHYTACQLEESMRILTYAGSPNPVSSHYLIADDSEASIGADGTVFQLVEDDKRAWHAGVSYWRGVADLNTTAIGIEICNLNGNEYFYTNTQQQSIITLCQIIIEKYSIEPPNIIGHSDISPSRKIDPGSLFPWDKLYEANIGAMPDEDTYFNFLQQPVPKEIQEWQKLWKAYGYDIEITNQFDEQTKNVLSAFYSHFSIYKTEKPELNQETYAMLQALVAKYQ